MTWMTDKKSRSIKILIVDDELPIREVLSAALKDEGHQVFTASDGDTGLKAMEEFKPEVVFLDIWMPGSLDGLEVLTTARTRYPNIDFVMISGHGTIETAVKATKLGAWDFIEKPLSMDKISIIISNIRQYQIEKEEKMALLNHLRQSIALVGESPKISQLKQAISSLALTPNWILLQGENGSGKALTSQNIHYLSSRASKPLYELSSHHLSDDLFETELFGYERGALPGAEWRQKGKLELIDGGTLFIDDLAELSLVVQAKLLKLVQEKKFKRLGGSESIPVNVRFVFATAADLEQRVSEGRFSQELLYHLNLTVLKLPSLREHSEDIPELLEIFSAQIAKATGIPKKEFSEASRALMKQYEWPGNVRELRNFIERVYILTPSDFVDVHDLMFAGLSSPGSETQGHDLPTFREARSQFEKEYISKKLSENGGNISRTAEVIGLERSYLHRKIKVFGIDSQKGSDEL